MPRFANDASTGCPPSENIRYTRSYDGKAVGEFFADVLEEKTAFSELRAMNDHHDVFPAPCLNDRSTTGKAIEV